MYHYSPDTNTYVGKEISAPPPLGVGLPAYCTDVAPPEAQAGYSRVWIDGSWQQVEDHRGETGYLNGVATTITALGPLPNSWSVTAPAPSAEEAMAAKISALDAVLQAALDAARTDLLTATLADDAEGIAAAKAAYSAAVTTYSAGLAALNAEA